MIDKTKISKGGVWGSGSSGLKEKIDDIKRDADAVSQAAFGVSNSMGLDAGKIKVLRLVYKRRWWKFWTREYRVTYRFEWQPAKG